MMIIAKIMTMIVMLLPMIITMLTMMMGMMKLFSQAGGQLEGSFHLRSVVQGILAQVLISPIKQHKWVPLNSTSYNCLAFSFQLCLQVASNLRTSCEQTDNAFKKRVDEVFLKFTF